jgi:hypothetical protein
MCGGEHHVKITSMLREWTKLMGARYAAPKPPAFRCPGSRRGPKPAT